MAETWCPFAKTAWHGPSWKTNGAITRSGKGMVLHSAEGSFNGALDVLFSNTPSSWHFTIDDNGDIYQHYPIETQTWHAGPSANPYFVGVEHTGTAGYPTTDAQVASDIKLIKWLSNLEGWEPNRFNLNQRQHNLFEHNEFMQTSCPSNRIRWSDIMKGLTDTPTPAPIPAPSADQIRLGAVKAMLDHYNFKVTGQSVDDGHYIIELLEKDGTPSDPPSYIAVYL